MVRDCSSGSSHRYTRAGFPSVQHMTSHIRVWMMNEMVDMVMYAKSYQYTMKDPESKKKSLKA